MFGFFDPCVVRYCEFANISRSSLKTAKTPSIDDSQLTFADLEEEGQFSSDAAKVLMKVLYGARLVRYDILWVVNSLAREVSRWTKA